MLRVALAGLRAHTARLLLTACAIMVGVSFLAGSLVYGDTARAAFYDDLARSARNVDLVIRPTTGLLDPSVTERVRAVPGVRAVDPRVVGALGVLDAGGRLLTRDGHVGYGLSLPGAPALSRFDVARGRLPAAPGEVALDRKTVEDQKFGINTPLRVLDRQGAPHDLTLVGVLDLGVNRQFNGSAVAALTTGDLTALTGTSRYTEIAVSVAPGTDPERVRAAVPDARVLPAAQVRAELAWRAGKYVDGFLRVLIAFGLVALTVSGFVIYNTFAMLAAQRGRELALLRCVGASRLQVFGAVLTEAAGLGVVASLGGLALSLLVGWGLLVSREFVGARIPAHALVVGGPTVAVAVGFGTLLALAGAVVPAFGASRVPPLTALRHAAALEARGRPRAVRLGVAGTLAAVGAGCGAVGTAGGFGGLPLVLGGAMLVFLGFAAAAPLVVGRLVALVGWVPGRLLGAPVRLAAVNARRNPRRTAATTTALMIGVTLMSLFSVLLATARTQSGVELRENFRVDFRVAPAAPVGAVSERTRVRAVVPREVMTALRTHPEFDVVAPVRTAALGGGRTVWSVAPEGLRGPIRPEVTAGDLGALGPGTVALHRDPGRRLGDQVALGPLGTLTVVALYDDAPVDGGVLVSWDQFDRTYGAGDAHLVLVTATGTPVEARQVLDEVVRAYPLLQVTGEADQAEALAGSLDQLLGIFAALLGMSVLIAVFGIGNTLALSVLERTAESATLRALGLSRRQLRGMLLAEAGLMGAVGAGSGAVFGGAVGWAAALGLINAYGHGSPTVPWGQLALFATVATVAAMTAAVLPARHAARASIVTAVSQP
ncbi:membrane protein [Longispora fulva]|uniref:Putative ABC transport system permease protein n=1 Tax=Longispora fulva TaxID=619741 RepID=A0A8J7KX37_9ACTN|nr:FtsX-like permease family protein [Longispora fulva]MBG6137282.1 putative ABC transport system permease protein [Longispora fulva]GIG61365.1 membrane protein [Longispora fulva]